MLTQQILSALALLPAIALCYNPSPTTKHGIRYSDRQCSTTTPCPKWTYCDQGTCSLCIECNWRTIRNKDIGPAGRCNHPVQCRSDHLGVADSRNCPLLSVQKESDHIVECSPKFTEHGNPLGTRCTERTSGALVQNLTCTWLMQTGIAVWQPSPHTPLFIVVGQFRVGLRDPNSTTIVPSVVSPTTSSPVQYTEVPNYEEAHQTKNDSTSQSSLILPVVIGTALGISLASLLAVILARSNIKRTRISTSHSIVAVEARKNLDTASVKVSRLPREPDEISWPDIPDNTSQFSELPNSRFQFQCPVEDAERFLSGRSENYDDDDYATSNRPHPNSSNNAAVPTANPPAHYHLTRLPPRVDQYTQPPRRWVESDSGTSMSLSNQSRDRLLRDQETFPKQF